MPRAKQVPAYCLHKPTGQARVRINGRDHYLGQFGSAESRQNYARLIAEAFRPGGGEPPGPQGPGQLADLSINELFVRYLEFATSYYLKNDEPTGEVENMKHAMRSLRALYESSLAGDFGPLALKAVRHHMVTVEGLSRKVINSRINRIRRIFKWAVSEELVPPSTFEALRAVEGLRLGRSGARETEPVRPVADAHVEATKRYLPPQVADMVELERLTSMRPGDLVILRPCDIEKRGEVWIYEPSSHKTQYLGRRRFVVLGPKAQRVLAPYLLNRVPQAYVFSPRETEAWRREQRRRHQNRKTPVFPCERRRLAHQRAATLRRTPKRPLGDCYTSHSYRRAIQYAIEQARKAGVEIPSWHPNQLRHSRATEIRRQFGLEAAQVVLGHTRADVTQIYAERDLARAMEIARMTG